MDQSDPNLNVLEREVHNGRTTADSALHERDRDEGTKVRCNGRRLNHDANMSSYGA